MLWIIISCIFVGQKDHIQFVAAFLTLAYSLYQTLVLFVQAKSYNVCYINYISWLTLALVIVLEVFNSSF